MLYCVLCTSILAYLQYKRVKTYKEERNIYGTYILPAYYVNTNELKCKRNYRHCLHSFSFRNNIYVCSVCFATEIPN